VTRGDIVKAILEFRNDAAMVLGPGKSTQFLWEAPLHPATIYNMELTYATAVALGIAIGAPKQRVISLEGDGSMFGAAPILGTVARRAPANLTIVVLANGIWGTSDGTIPVTIPPAQFTELAVGCGWSRDRVTFAPELPQLNEALRKSVAEPGPWFISAEAQRGPEDASISPDGQLRVRTNAPIDLIESVDSTRRFLMKLAKA
jgi:hypothetical protein